jgi:hypothetical protein
MDFVPVGTPEMSINGKPGKLVKIDDTTVDFVFQEPYPMFVDILSAFTMLGAGYTLGSTSFGNFGGPYAPAHYLKQFHPKHVDKAKIDQLNQALFLGMAVPSSLAHVGRRFARERRSGVAYDMVQPRPETVERAARQDRALEAGCGGIPTAVGDRHLRILRLHARDWQQDGERAGSVSWVTRARTPGAALSSTYYFKS